MALDPALDNPTDRMSRQQWAAAFAILLSTFPMYALEKIVAGGEKQFRMVAEPHLRGHAFHAEDLSFIFKALENSVKERKRLDPIKIWDAAQK